MPVRAIRSDRKRTALNGLGVRHKYREGMPAVSDAPLLLLTHHASLARMKENLPNTQEAEAGESWLLS